ncbi:transglutaminase domain-containing protein [Saccharicrinis aurantiacus]|uniref:transglutaminase domain-containing protein n=1 Tax=Saccharicrinis aurantiacus TaxID=1849719 RepID=UPI00248FE240|nr:transglutaminase domain-containing protein [Saccharicrinis aurantiacus]
MKAIFVILITLVNICLHAQHYNRVDSVVLAYGRVTSYTELAEKITQDFSTEETKARGIYTWIANNVDYDVKKYRKFIKNKGKKPKRKWKNHYEYEQSVSKKTFRKQKGICGDYSILYKHLCSLCGVECEVISGFSKTREKEIGRKFGEKHAWNAVNINQNWKLIDVTWSAGYVNQEKQLFIRQFNDYYFCTNPEQFFLNHFPRKHKWLLTNKTKDDFKKIPLYGQRYRSLDFETKEPNEGVIYSENETVILQFSNKRKTPNITYKFAKEEYGNYVLPKEKDGNIIVEIKYKKRGSDYLHLYMNGSHYATYKVKRK